jgi:hypothetical protein
MLPTSNTDTGTEIWHQQTGQAWYDSQSAPSAQPPRPTQLPSAQWSQQYTGETAATVPVATEPVPAPITPVKEPIVAQGWDEPEFHVPKKQDDGTNIWGDPEAARALKVMKWTSSATRAVAPKPAAPVSAIEASLDAAGLAGVAGAQAAQPGAQQKLPTSQWNNTPAAPFGSEWTANLVDTTSWALDASLGASQKDVSCFFFFCALFRARVVAF